MRKAAGFTLLEIMVVLALLGLLIGLVAPNYVGQLERSSRRFALDQFQGQLAQLPRWARLSGDAIVLDKLTEPRTAGGEDILSLPEHWQATFTPPLRISAQQMCSTTTIDISDDKGIPAARYQITGPDCMPAESDL